MLKPATETRRRDLLTGAFGNIVIGALADPDVIEIMLNPDGRLWIDTHATGRRDTGTRIEPETAERIIRLVATQAGRAVTTKDPIVSADLPGAGERFEGLLPPVVAAPTFSIRKHAPRLIALGEYVASGVMAGLHATALRQAILDKKTILVVGGTGSGKTTLVNALLAEIAKTGDRILILEDTRELQCAAADKVELRTSDAVTLERLVRSSLRLNPSRIIVGEVRGADALDMLKAWNTGHPGGVATLHANSAEAGLHRLEQLIGETTLGAAHQLIAETIDMVVFITREDGLRRVKTVAHVRGLTGDGYALDDVAPDLTLISQDAWPETERTRS